MSTMSAYIKPCRGVGEVLDSSNSCSKENNLNPCESSCKAPLQDNFLNGQLLFIITIFYWMTNKMVDFTLEAQWDTVSLIVEQLQL